jgi:pimeloyl-ACP methyl ester carboxylesterase
MTPLPTITGIQLGGSPDLPLLVCGPSLGTSATALWSPVATLLADDFHVVAWDLPGHGGNRTVPSHDGNEFEVMWMLPKAKGGEYADAAPVERLDLPAEVRTWGGVRTAAELVPVDAP